MKEEPTPEYYIKRLIGNKIMYLSKKENKKLNHKRKPKGKFIFNGFNTGPK
jgi:hypothetical protein